MILTFHELFFAINEWDKLGPTIIANAKRNHHRSRLIDLISYSPFDHRPTKSQSLLLDLNPYLLENITLKRSRFGLFLRAIKEIDIEDNSVAPH